MNRSSDKSLEEVHASVSTSQKSKLKNFLSFLGPAYLVWLFATHYGLGWDAPWFIVQLFAVGYAPLTLLVIGLAWLAAAGQLAALAADRYAPYPAPGERPRRGPVRELIRTLIFAPRRSATAAAPSRRAVKQ